MPTLFVSEEGIYCNKASRCYSWKAICEAVNEKSISNILKEEENVQLNEQRETTLTQYILEHAKVLFAIAERTNVLNLVPMLETLELTDDYLPISWEKEQNRAKSLSGASKDDKALTWFDFSTSGFSKPRQHKSWIDNFCDSQWKFLAPVFTDNEIVYPLHDHCLLPFFDYALETGAGGANCTLFKANIDASHWMAIRSQSETFTDRDSAIPVAIKEIRKQHEATGKWVEVEIAALELVRSLRHPHLINFLTSYRHAGNHYLIFDWANGGNLNQFWETNNPKYSEVVPLSHRETIIWAIQQMAGIAAGLNKLHTEDQHGVHCRHGDLKPANIVRSTSKNDLTSKSRGRLLITDMGVAKINDKATHVGRSSGNVKATIRYQSPEFYIRLNPDAPTSRSYDLWSMGCTLLEFIVWLLYGPTQLKAFNESFPNTTFFSGSPEEGIHLNPAVKHWIDHMKSGPLSETDAHCISKALRDILDFILIRVLIRDVRPDLDVPVVLDTTGENLTRIDIPDVLVSTPDAEENPSVKEHEKRAESGELLRLLQSVCKSINDPSYALTNPPFGEADHVLQPPLRRRPTALSITGRNNVLPVTGHLQIPTGNIHETTSLLSWLQLQPRYAELPQGQAHPDQPYVTEYLRDSWDAIPDSDLALDLFPEMKSLDVVPSDSVGTHTKTLCKQCSDEFSGVFSLRFVCNETIEALEMRKDQCGVCWMLLQHALKTGSDLQTKVKFLRSGSYLVQSALEKGIPDKAIFSIVVGPGITAAPKDLQRSFPKLPQTVTMPGREARDVKSSPKPKLTITGDEPKFLIMKKWVDDCDKNHRGKKIEQPNCNPERSSLRLPTRLIYVGQGAVINIHLDCRCDRDSGLKYIALSHRWNYPQGDDEWMTPDGKVKNFCTTDDNLDEYKDPNRGINFADMPKTFRDAIEVSRGLGIEYLWIDSLCIIQNQPDNADFNAESRRMRDVYNGAYLTIASTGAVGTTDGFLNQKEDRACVRIDTTRKVLDGKSSESISDKPCTVYVCDAIDDFRKDVDESDMATRGWIFQERALSRRTIHFAKSQMYWECGAGVCCETLTRLFNRKATFMSDPDFPSQAGKYQKGMKIIFYQALYQYYSGLNFSVIANRAVAMDGLESKIFTRFQTKGAYGIMDGEFLHRSLLWQRQDPLPTGAMRKTSFGSNDPTPPSWSWMAVGGRIKYLSVEFGTVEWNIDEVLSPFRTTGIEFHGSVPASQIVPIRAAVRGINWKTINLSQENIILDREKSPRDILGLMCIVMGTKIDQPSAGGSRLVEASFRIPVLLVAPKSKTSNPANADSYERVGVGKLMDHEIEAESAEKRWVEIS